MKKIMLACLILVGTLSLYAQLQEPQESQEPLSAEDSIRLAIFEKALNLDFQTGTIDLGDGLALLHVGEEFKYLSPENAEFVLSDLWGNPPGGNSLGMLFLKDDNPLTDSTYAVDIYYQEDGHIKDDDAEEIDYDELLETMKEDAIAESEYRMANGYESIELIGWASPPFYDLGRKKLHWAKEFNFGGSEENTLNYNIRILGRKGVLVLNVIGEMYVLDQVKADIDKILASVEFTEGNRYSDFDPSMDEVAAYGIGGLIAGKVLAKAGILAKIGIFLAKGWKIIAIGLVAVVAAIRKFFTGKNKSGSEA